MLAGVKALIRLNLRRDRLKLPLWTIGIVASLLSMVPLLQQTYGDSKSLISLHQTFGLNPAGLFLTGPMDLPSLGGLMTIETLLWWGLVIAFANTFLIIRHTRHNEEIGAQELILSGQVHRSAALTSSLWVALIFNGLLAIGLGGGLSLFGDIWGNGSGWLYGLALAAFGLVWAAIAAVIAQLVQSSRSANGLLSGLIGLGFLLRGIGDFLGSSSDGLIQPAWISLLSPFGWLQMTRPLTVPSFAPLLIPLLVSLLLIPLAYLLLSRRDVGLGLLPSRAGRQRASRGLKRPFGLTLYLQRNIFIGWLLGVLAMAATIGLLVPGMTNVYDSSENLKAMIASMGGSGALVPAFLSAMLSVMVMIILGYLVHGISRLRSEEASGRLENLLATRLSRLKWCFSHSAATLLGGLAMLVLTGAVLALCVNISSDISASPLEYILASLAYFPVLLLFGGLYLLLFGILPRLATSISWLYFSIVVFMSWLAPLLKLGVKYMNISPLSHLAAMPAETIKWQPLLVITAASLAMMLIGLLTFIRRDIKLS